MTVVRKTSRRLVLGTVRGDTKGSIGPNMETVGLWTKPGLRG
jgi:hypothetical protein